MRSADNAPLNVVVGPQRTASTYLHSLLANGSTFHVPLVKEINFLLALSNWSEHFATWASGEFLDKFLLNFGEHDSVLNNLSPYNKMRLSQLKDFKFTKERYLEIYQTPFPGFDISPSYCAINEQSWIRIRDEFKLNVYVTVRDPVERSWSAVNLYAKPLKKSMPDGYMLNGVLQDEAELTLLLTRLSAFSKEVIFCEYGVLIPMLHRVFGESLTIIDYVGLVSEPLELLVKLREINGILAPDRLEKFRGHESALAFRISDSAKNSLSISAAPTWFIDWHSKSFPGEASLYQMYKDSSNSKSNLSFTKEYLDVL
jgi:hypothetical protein